MEKQKNPMWWGMVFVTVLGGVYYLGNGMIHLISYFTSTPDAQPMHLQVFSINILLAIPFWLVACASTRALGEQFPRLPRLLIHRTTGLLVLFFILANLYAIYVS